MTTKADRQVDQDFNNKLRLELTFRPEIKSIFSRMMKSYSAVVARTGAVPDASFFRGEWKGALRKQYDRVQKMFSGTVREFQGKFLPNWSFKQEEDDDQDPVLFAFALQKWSDEHSVQSAEKITKTNQKNYTESLVMARQELNEAGEPFGNRDLALGAVAILRRKFGGRIEAITSFETQSSAESTKLIEAEITAGVEPSIIRPETAFPLVSAKKRWRTVGDNRVRDIHKEVNFQERLITRPFDVNGERLMHPGDTSLGASAGNVINCRCSAIYDI